MVTTVAKLPGKMALHAMSREGHEGAFTSKRRGACGRACEVEKKKKAKAAAGKLRRAGGGEQEF